MIMLHILTNIKHLFLAALLIKVFVLMINLASQLFFYRGKNAVNEFIEAILKEMNYCKQMIKMYFNKNLAMSAGSCHVYRFCSLEL